MGTARYNEFTSTALVHRAIRQQLPINLLTEPKFEWFLKRHKLVSSMPVHYWRYTRAYKTYKDLDVVLCYEKQGIIMNAHGNDRIVCRICDNLPVTGIVLSREMAEKCIKKNDFNL